MMLINLKSLYPFVDDDIMIQVPDDVLRTIEKFEREEANYQRKIRWNHSTYSLDAHNIILHDVLRPSPSPLEIIEDSKKKTDLYMALLSLPEKQSRRIYGHFFLGMSKTAIAKSEGVAVKAVHESIDRGLRNLKKFLIGG